MTQEWKEEALTASRRLNLLSTEKKNEVLLAVAQKAIDNTNLILNENKKDLAEMDESNPMFDRLLLTTERIEGIAKDIRNVASLDSPLDVILEEKALKNGLNLKKVTVPFGVIGIIYEARPNVSFDVFSLCFKSGNACVLKGGTDAYNSNLAIVNLIRTVLKSFNLDENMVLLMPAGREATAELLNAAGYVDLIIPRGGKGLINYVRNNSRVPVIETGAGVVHAYFDEFAALEQSAAIILNAKTRRVSVCNALDCLIINKKRLSDLPFICKEMAEQKVIIEADAQSFTALEGKYPADLLQKATNESYGTEFISYRMSIKTVTGVNEAITHISQFSSKHSECILTEDEITANRFQKEVDAACVYVNAPTSYTDGAEFEMGAEIGISTQKLHARGPMALPELCSYKWLIVGKGQIRS